MKPISRRIRGAFCLSLLVLLATADFATARTALDALIRDYQEAKRKAIGPRKRGGGGGGKKRIQSVLQPLLNGIADVKTPESLAFLAGELASPTGEVAAASASAIARQNSLPAATALLGGLKARSAADARRGGSVDLNAEIRAALGSMKDADVREWLADGAYRWKGARAPQLVALLTLAGEKKLEAARPRVASLLDHRDRTVAEAAAAALVALGIGEDTSTLIRLIKKSSTLAASLRIKLLDALASSGDAEALDAVLEVARKGDVDDRSIAMGSLGLRPRSAEALEGVLEGLRHRHPQVRNAALRALESFRFARMIPALIEFLGAEKVERLKIDGLELLVDLSGHNMGPVVEDWRKWWEVAAPSFEFSRKKDGKTRVNTRGLEYFGIEVSSKRIAFLVDASISMLRKPDGKGGKAGKPDRQNKAGEPGSKVDIMKKELTRILRELPEDAHINIIYFHRSFFPWKKGLQPIRGKGRQDAIDFVQGLTCELKTNIYDTLEFALQDREVDTIYLLSDGQPVGGKFTKPADILREVRVLNRLRGVTIHGLTFGRKSSFLEQLASENGGVHRAINK